MAIFKNHGLAVCLSVATILGACGGDEGGDDGDLFDDSPSASSGSRDAGSTTRPSGDAGVSPGSGASTDAGGSAPSTPGDAGAAGFDLEIGQDTPKEPATRFEFVVNRAQETPACAAGSDQALGVGRVIIADSGRWVEVTVGSKFLSARANKAHVHFGDRGVAGPVVLDFGALPDADVFFKRFTAADFPKQPPADLPDFAAFVKALQAGKAYVNLHTPACAAGEIRGQIQQ